MFPSKQVSSIGIRFLHALLLYIRVSGHIRVSSLPFLLLCVRFLFYLPNHVLMCFVTAIS